MTEKTKVACNNIYYFNKGEFLMKKFCILLFISLFHCMVTATESSSDQNDEEKFGDTKQKKNLSTFKLSEDSYLDLMRIKIAITEGDETGYREAFLELQSKTKIPTIAILKAYFEGEENFPELMLKAPKNKDFFNKELVEFVILIIINEGNVQKLDELIEIARMSNNKDVYRSLYNLRNAKVADEPLEEFLSKLKDESREYRAITYNTKTYYIAYPFFSLVSLLLLYTVDMPTWTSLGLLTTTLAASGLVINSCRKAFKLSKSIKYRGSQLYRVRKMDTH